MILWKGSLRILRQNKVFSLLGIAMRGRNLVSGEHQTLEAVKKGSAMLVIIAEDASDNTKKLFSDKCSFYKVPVFRYGTKESLGRAIGKDMRSSVCVCDEGLADAMIRQLEKELCEES
ncbi:MAG: ribosomal L7Ae/L30e/S12e/Gadd45 family protein [Acetatifactor sp.]|nr:ribosomal L7Ae/L30e/S12e/Gadd45 family protein [Acetatifactor sp.]MDE7043807.1 ribosomal L7Ae/L30e/S12e/Gadd45 family protein [Acetatifactor sp.]